MRHLSFYLQTIMFPILSAQSVGGPGNSTGRIHGFRMGLGRRIERIGWLPDPDPTR